MRMIRNMLGRAVSGISVISIIACFVIMGMTTVDIVLRKVSNYAVLGSNEITEMLMVALMAFGIPALHVAGGHIKVDIFVDMIPVKGRHFFISLMLFVESAFCGLMVRGGFNKVQSVLSGGVATALLRIPHYPFAALFCGGLALFCILLFIDAVISFADGINSLKKPT